MNALHIGQRVITEHGEGVVNTIADGNADTDILRYEVISNAASHWLYLDEIIIITQATAKP